MDSITKQELRQSFRKSRLALTTEERREKSEAIAERLLQAVDWSGYTFIHCFEPITRLGEVDLVDFVAALRADKSDIRVYTSRKFGDEWQVVSADTDNAAKPAPKPVPKFDAIIVPMLGFDPRTLHRVGYGGGYYDRFLASQPAAKKIGVCYEAGKAGHVPAEPHDIPMDTIITERGTYT